MPDTLPDGWKSTTLAKVASTQLGKAINPKERDGPNQRPYLRNANVQWDRVDVTDVFTMHFSEAEAERLCLEPGDLLTCEGGIVGRSAIWSGDMAGCCFQNAVHRIRPLDQEVSAEWLLETLRHLTDTGVLATRAQGNTIQHLSQQVLRNLPVVFPVRHEQDAIINVLNRARSKRSSASSHLDGARLAIERFRQAVFAAACSGRLTADWRETHSSDSVSIVRLLEQCAYERRAMLADRGATFAVPESYALPQLPSGWEWRSLSELVVRIADADHKMPKAQTSGIPYISTKDFTDSGIDLNNAKLITPDDFASLTRKVRPDRGDILISRYGTVGQVRRVETQNAFQASYSIAIVKTTSDWGLGSWIELCLRSATSQSFMRHYIRASAQPDLGLRHIRQIPIAVPPPSERVEIVRKVDQLCATVDGLANRIDKAARSVDRNSQAVLAKAFRGQLALAAV
jgi:type I restriction enzyme S subunit